MEILLGMILVVTLVTLVGVIYLAKAIVVKVPPKTTIQPPPVAKKAPPPPTERRKPVVMDDFKAYQIEREETRSRRPTL